MEKAVTRFRDWTKDNVVVTKKIPENVRLLSPWVSSKPQRRGAWEGTKRV